MDNKRKRILILVVVVGIIALVIYGISDIYHKKMEHISRNIELNFKNCSINWERNTHSGFLGDGEYFVRLECSNIDYDNLAKNWKKLPLSESIKKAVETKFCEGNGCKDIYEKYSIPSIEKGFYYFFDRHSDAIDKYDDTELNNRSSWNYTLALLDPKTNTIYYYEIDT